MPGVWCILFNLLPAQSINTNKIAFIDLKNNNIFLIGSYICTNIHGVHASLIR